MKIRTATYAPTHRRLLKDLGEIKAVLDVESQLIQALVRMARQREVLGFAA